MKDIDGNNVENGCILESDLCIIGGGAAGIAIACQFIDTKQKVILIESGDHSYNDKTQSLYEFNNSGHPMRAQKGYISRNRYLGGSTNTWHGGCSPLNNIDFEQRSWVPNSGWPINSNDLQHSYRDAARFLKLPEYDYFINKDWLKYIKSPPVNFLSDSDLEPEIFLFANKPLNTRVAYANSIKRSSNIQLLLNSNVINLEAHSDASHVQRVHIATLAGKKYFVKAKNYILACGGWENARLLLLSNGNNEKGLGNKYDNVGRYYNEHPKIILGSITPFEKSLLSPIMIWKRRISNKGFMRVSMKLSLDMQKQHQLLNHYIQPIYPRSFREAITHSETFINRFSILSKENIHRLAKLSSSLFQLADAYERILFNRHLRFDTLGVVSHFEQIPNRESRVSLSYDKDLLGLNKLDVRLVVSSHEKDNMIRYHKVFNEILQRKNLGRLDSEFDAPSSDWPSLTDSSHHIGTTRMSNDPKYGVVDKNCKVHGVENLFVASSSVFPTGGHVNPTLSIVALALRLSTYLKKKISL